MSKAGMYIRDINRLAGETLKRVIYVVKYKLRWDK